MDFNTLFKWIKHLKRKIIIKKQKRKRKLKAAFEWSKRRDCGKGFVKLIFKKRT